MEPKEQLHNLDLGAGRYVEIGLSIVLHEILDIEVLKSVALSLVTAWPTLSHRMNLARTEFTPSPDPVLQGLWKAKGLKSTLGDELPHLQSISAHNLVDSTLLNELLSFDESLQDKIFPRALTIRVTSLSDACLIKFAVQHPFCDAAGVYSIVNAFCALLAGRAIKAMGPRVPLELRKDIVPHPPSSSNTLLDPTAQRHRDLFAQGWGPLLSGIWRQTRNQWLGGPKRVERTAMIPNFVIDKLVKDAEIEGIRVTRNDLLVAWIYIATMPEISQLAQKQDTGPPQLSFVMNIARLLKHDSQFHNPWIVITLPDLQATELSKRDPIVAAAKHIRTAISEARQLAPVRQILDQHSSVRDIPIGTASLGCREPNVLVSSWANLPLYDIEFVSADGRQTNPVFVQAEIIACPMFRLAGVTFDDAILTWVGKEGFWIQGSLDENLWNRIVDFRLYRNARTTSPEAIC